MGRYNRLHSKGEKTQFSDGESATAGSLGVIPSALAPKSKQQIQRQAAQLVNRLYKPVLVDIRQQEGRAQAIYDKRTADNQYYQEWLNSQNQALQNHIDAANQQLVSAATGVQNSVNDVVQGLPQEEAARAAATPGNVTNPNQSTAQAMIGAAGEAAVKETAAATDQAIDTAKTSTNTEPLARASEFAFIAGQQAKAASDLWGKMKDLGDARQKAKLEKASKGAEEVARLLDQEIAKAQSRVQLQQIAQQLGLQNKRLALDALTAQQQSALQSAQLGLDQQQFDWQKQVDTWNHLDDLADNTTAANVAKWNHQDDLADNAAQAQGSHQDQVKASKEVVGAVNNAIDALNGAAATNAWTQSGGQIGQMVDWMVKKFGADPTIAKAAIEIRYYGKGLTHNTLQELQALGLLHTPDNW